MTSGVPVPSASVPMSSPPRVAPLPARATFADRLLALKRRRWPGLWTGITVLLLVGVGAMLWPPTFRSTGKILIEQQELPENLVESTITTFADERIQIISQRVMTTDNLLRLIDRFNLYPELRRNHPREQLLARMRKDIHFQMISADVMDPRDGRPTKADIAFSVSYDSGSPDTASRVANQLVSLYLDENLRNRQQLSADAENFLTQQTQSLQQSIASTQAKLAKFKGQHLNALPDEVAINRETLIRSQDQLREIDTQLASLNEQATYLDAQLAQISPSSQVYTSTGERVLSPADQLKYLRTQYDSLRAIYAPDHPDVLRLKREIAGLEQAVGEVDSSNDLNRELEQARTQMAQLRQRYSADYPDVVQLQQRIDTLSQAIRNAPAAAAGTATAQTPQPDNPAYIEVKAQREANTAQRDSLLQQRAAVQATITDLENRLAAAPAVQRDYAELASQLDNQEMQFRQISQKQMEAKIAQNMEDQQKGERFTLIEPPLVPEQPTSPNRPMLLVLGLVLGLASGVGVAMLLDTRDDSVRNGRDLETLLDIPPLAIVPQIWTLADRKRQRWQRCITLFGTVGGVAIALMLVDLFYRPLDVLWDVALRRLSG